MAVLAVLHAAPHRHLLTSWVRSCVLQRLLPLRLYRAPAPRQLLLQPTVLQLLLLLHHHTSPPPTPAFHLQLLLMQSMVVLMMMTKTTQMMTMQ